jgi:hypothetical protein
VIVLMGKRGRWRVWRTERLLLAGVKVIGVALLTIVSLLAGEVPVPGDRTRGRPRVSVVNKLSDRPLPITGGGLVGRLNRWIHNQELPGYLTVDLDNDIFMWEAQGRDEGTRPIALVLQPLAAVTVTDRWTYRFGRRTAVVVSLSSGADLWLTGRSTYKALRQLGLREVE